MTVARRGQADKEEVPLPELRGHVAEALPIMQEELLAAARERLEDGTTDVDGVDEALEVAAEGFARLPWAVLGEDGEAKLAAEGISVRCLQRPDGSVPEAEDEDDVQALVARAY